MAEVIRYVTPVFRASFPEVFEAKAFDGGKPKFSVSAVWDPRKFSTGEKKLWKGIMAAIDAACLEKFKKKREDLPANYKTVPRDGGEKADMEGYGDGTLFANLTTMIRPGVIDLDKQKIGPEEGNAEQIYPGCYCRATVTVYTYDNKGKGVALGLMNLQKIKDGDRLDSRTNAEEDFDDDVDNAWLEEQEDDDHDELDN